MGRPDSPIHLILSRTIETLTVEGRRGIESTLANLVRENPNFAVQTKSSETQLFLCGEDEESIYIYNFFARPTKRMGRSILCSVALSLGCADLLGPFHGFPLRIGH
jgi:hypothetical protein